MSGRLLEVSGLEVSFLLPEGGVPAVRDVSFAVGPGQTLGLVGESGCGKSVTALALLGLLPASAEVRGRVQFRGGDVLSMGPAQLRSLRGREIGMVFQDPTASLNPVFTIGQQVAEAITAHHRLPRAELRSRCLELLREVGIPAPEARLRAHPGDLSGGLRQRVGIAAAVACRPRLLLADEPTTALDVTVQAEIMGLLRRLQQEREMALLLITHDLGLVAQNTERVMVMYAGYVVETSSTRDLFAAPLHPYTRGLLASLPGGRRAARGQALTPIPGTVPHPTRVPSGCPFRDRCPLAVDRCREGLPSLEEKIADHRVRCIRVER